MRSANVIAADALTCLVFSPAPPTLFAGRGEEAHLVGPETGPGGGEANLPHTRAERPAHLPRPRGGTTQLTDFVGPKLSALSAYRSQFPFLPEMYPDDL